MFIWRETWEQQLQQERILLERLEKLKFERDKYKRELEAIREQIEKVLPPRTTFSAYTTALP